MFKKYVTLVIAFTLMPMLLSAQDAKVKAPVKFDQEVVSDASNSNIQHVTPKTAANYVFVDDMQNGYSPAIGALNVVAYEPYSGVLAVVHRGRTTYALGSGEIWWNISTDDGATWTRSTTSVQNGNTPNNGRYPSMALANPTHGTDLESVSALFSWPQLTPSAFGYLGYGVSSDLYTADYAAEDQGPPAYSSQVPCWAADNSEYYFWASDYGVDGNAGTKLFSTTDWSTITTNEVPEWLSEVFLDNGTATLGGVSYNGVEYYGMIGSYDTARFATGPNTWGIGYSKSTDNGATWSTFKTVDWTIIPATEKYDYLWDYKKGDEFIGYQGDINVDKNGMVHLVTSLTDYDYEDGDVTDEFGYNAIVEFIETETGWDAKIIAEGDALLDSTFTQQEGMALGQMGPSVYLATNKERDIFVAQYVTSGTPGDSLCDIFITGRKIDEDWSDPINLTETANMNENGSHLAPYVKTVDENNVVAYSMYYYETGNTGPIADPGVAADIFIAAVPLTFVGVEEEISANYNFTLDQNFPNPFNPTTTIKYSVPESGFVTLKVYDVLGKEVATLVNESVTAGSHSVNFDAASLASGMYIYKMQAGNFQNVKKMMLMK